MFTNPKADEKWIRARKQQRDRVLYLTDKIMLATYHKRPEHEIAELMADLRAAVTRKDN